MDNQRGGFLTQLLGNVLGNVIGFGVPRGGFWQTQRGYPPYSRGGSLHGIPPPFYPTSHPRFYKRYMIP